MYFKRGDECAIIVPDQLVVFRFVRKEPETSMPCTLLEVTTSLKRNLR